MRAITVTEHGGPEVLTYGEAPDPVPGPGQVLVRTSAIGVNFIDTYFREGMYPTALPYIPGSEGSGTVVALGEGVTHRAVGDVVAWCEGPGSYAELVAVPADRTVVVPDGVAPEVAASVLLQGMTAHYLTHDSHPVQAGDTVLVHAGAGGTGLLVTQMATALGARVITTVSTDEKERLSREAGAWQVLRYDEDVAARVRELTDGAGVAAVYDGVGKDTFEASLLATRHKGIVVLFGAASGPVPPFDLQRLNPLGSLFVQRPTLAHHVATAEDFARRSGAVLDGLRDGSLRFTVGATYPLAEVGRAHTDLQARRTTGSVALLP
ncbi:quinone oxidoreductase [Tsukamurella tyrosinosolvens]|uniref:quinone oxidoreductase family protein n=1 Tax=Tsukamurella tyrosinosolvens TaxID=57704 RepID=UPI000793631C|nr:quinone oxidoreductase [Tsukamurella tyrosinosolvens]KXP04302.1 NADPH:quinone reductase [Tsukamurella tyrosinosolvens]KZL97541.1 NADPH:quinone reductase [Tsukamurella tyrosinosolvens]MCA4995868.1 quinone oxidoreductase [Tsukamurella tyrosinosolvens]RDB49088.1 quinone oxidoreductase [Tsukamurella tyrosinosolvens]WEL91808.1 quinone oxidoreductase [Tsukamurella tyrosinosolvens]